MSFYQLISWMWIGTSSQPFPFYFIFLHSNWVLFTKNRAKKQKNCTIHLHKYYDQLYPQKSILQQDCPYIDINTINDCKLTWTLQDIFPLAHMTTKDKNQLFLSIKKKEMHKYCSFPQIPAHVLTCRYLFLLGAEFSQACLASSILTPYDYWSFTSIIFSIVSFWWFILGS